MPKISVVIPAFNVEAYIREAIASALAQTPPVDRVIVIDDGSTDGTKDVVSQFSDNRLDYRYQPNSGLGPARNAGMDLVDSGHVLFLDADDMLVDGLTSYLAAACDAHGSHLELIAFSALDFDHDTGAVHPSSAYFQWPLEGVFDRGRDFLFSALQRGGGPACAFLYAFDVDVARRNQPLRFLPILHEDEAFTPALFARCGKVMVSNQVLYRRRLRAGSIMRSKASMANVAGYLTAARWWQDADISRSPREARAVRRQTAKLYGRAILYAARSGLAAGDVARRVAELLPGFGPFVKADMRISALSRRIAQHVIRWRAGLRSP